SCFTTNPAPAVICLTSSRQAAPQDTLLSAPPTPAQVPKCPRSSFLRGLEFVNGRGSARVTRARAGARARGGMGGRGVDTGVGSWAALILLLVSSSVVLVLQWDKECDGGLRTWLLTTVCVTAICGILGAAFHGKGDGTRPSRFLDDDDDDVWGVGEDDDESIDVSVSSAGEGGVSGG
ncbi:unnamed protein product, partial [Scytosiphon promiscuus]